MVNLRDEDIENVEVHLENGKLVATVYSKEVLLSEVYEHLINLDRGEKGRCASDNQVWRAQLFRRATHFQNDIEFLTYREGVRIVQHVPRQRPNHLILDLDGEVLERGDRVYLSRHDTLDDFPY